ncbi:glycine cleavage system transcriptional repressor [Nocardioides albertanoniae]|uniref:Glycine cleavage system transcriptional repressor n=1 Tax=Nocardioides albertanoniae TaxID=1175486 RepID=A0A543ABK0_9ACTN|nr:ACT domain-containing protein [Nocardioides albertanoniae]TQL69927.1 glycine cleavage system transcriptional repressor [Nocardioides albertanoniae]
MTIHAITVLGHDRPGIIAETTARLAGLGLNLEDSTMTRLRGHFAMTLLCAGATDAEAIRADLAPIAADGTLTVTVYDLPDEHAASGPGQLFVLSVHGGDRPGIVSTVTAEIAAAGGNITDLTTRLSGDLYVVVAELELPASADLAELEASIERVTQELGVGATLRPLEADDL